MSRAKHRPPPLLWAYRHHVADAALGLLAVSFIGGTISTARDVAPDGTRAATVAAPTAVDLREPTGHGGPIGPVTGPSFAADLPVWEPADGPVLLAGQTLPQPTAPAPARAPAATPRPVEPAGLPPVTTAPPATAAAEPTSTVPPVIVPIGVDLQVDVTPEVTEPAPTPTEPPATDTQTETPTEPLPTEDAP